MKNNVTFSKLFLPISFALALAFVLFSPSTANALLSQDDPNNSGGFTVHSEKVDGTINIIAMLFGRVDIGEGNIYGLTITKELETPHGTLVYKIKSPGPVPISKLSGRTMGGLSLPNGICTPGKFGYICFEDVTMTMSEQSVNSISIPNATIEACFQHECLDDVNTAEVRTLSLDEGEEEIRSLSDVQADLMLLSEQFDTVDQLITDAKSKEEEINKEERPNRLRGFVQRLGDFLKDPTSLFKTSQSVRSEYDNLNENSTMLALITGVADDILKQMSKVIGTNEQYVTDIEEALSIFDGSDGKQLSDDFDENQLEALAAVAKAHESEEDVNIDEVKETLDELKAQLETRQSEVKALEDSGSSFLQGVANFYESIKNRGLALSEATDLEEEDREAISSTLDVAEPIKHIEKRIQNLVATSDESAVNDDLKQLDLYVTRAFEQVEEEEIPVDFLEKIAELSEKIEATLAQFEDDDTSLIEFKQIEKELKELATLIGLPERMAEKYAQEPLLDEEKNPFRVAMQDNVSRWKQLPNIFTNESENLQLEQLLHVFDGLKERISELADLIESSLEDGEVDEEVAEEEELDDEEEAGISSINKLLNKNGKKSNNDGKEADGESSTAREEVKSTERKDASQRGNEPSKKNSQASSSQPSQGKSSSGSNHRGGNEQSPASPQPDPRIKELADALKASERIVTSINDTIRSMEGNFIVLEQHANNLTFVGRLTGIHTINAFTSAPFDTHLGRLERQVNSLDKSVKDLRNSMANIERLLGSQAKANRDLRNLRLALDDVHETKERLEEIRKSLNKYPGYVVFVNTKKSSLDKMLRKFDNMLK